MHNLETNSRINALATEQIEFIRMRTNRLFALLMFIQAAAAVCAAVWLTPVTWSGSRAMTHVHVYAAIALGIGIASLPIYRAIVAPREYSTQIIISIAQALMSGLLIHLAGGRIETHFHVFGSLAFLAFYRDWKTLIPATAVIAADHFARGLFWTESVFGVYSSSVWRVVEHALWVVFIDVFLAYSCVSGRKDIFEAAKRLFEIENAAWKTEQEVIARTKDLSSAEEFQRAILDSQGAHIAIVDPDGEIVGTNTAWREFWDKNCGGDIKHRDANYLDVCESATGDCATEGKEIAYAIRRVLSGRAMHESVLYPCHSPDEKRWFRADVTALRSNGDGAVIAHHNVTDEVKKSIELEESHEANARLALVAERTENAVVITDRLGRIEWVNEGFTRLTEFKLEEIIGCTPGEFLQGKETDPEVSAVMRNGIREGTGFCVEVVNYTKSRHPYWVSIEVTPVINEQGEAERFIAIERDITKEMELKQQVDDEKKLLEAILESIPLQVYWKNDDLEFQGCNTAFAKYIGCNDRTEVIGFDEHTLGQAPPQTIDTFVEDAMIMSTGEAIHDENRVWQLADGSRRDLRVSKLPLKDESNETRGIVCLFNDVTDRNQLETQLAHAQKLESIGQLAAGIAHEINTPAQYVGDNTRFLRDEFESLLKVVDKYASQLDTTGPSKSWEERSGEIRDTLESLDYEFLRDEIPSAITQSLEGIDRITSIVRAMKDFSHPGSSSKQPADLNQAVASTVTVCSNRWKYAADLELDLDDSLPAVPCFVGELNQVILNLVVNAADAIAEQAGDGGEKGRIVVKTLRDRNDALIMVTDNGPGMGEEVRSKIFDPFFTTKEVGKGTGQGLAISHDVVSQKHSGSLVCESSPGEGATFIVRLPIGDQASAKEAA